MIFREDLTVVLSKTGSNLTVQLLLDTLQQTMEFESSISRKYNTPVLSLIPSETNAHVMTAGGYT